MLDGRMVPLPSQEMFLADSAQITKLRQNARIFDKDVKPYFPASTHTDSLRFFALPGEGTVRTLSFLLEERAVVTGDLYFKSPTLRWEARDLPLRVRARTGPRPNSDPLESRPATLQSRHRWAAGLQTRPAPLHHGCLEAAVCSDAAATCQAAAGDRADRRLTGLAGDRLAARAKIEAQPCP